MTLTKREWEIVEVHNGKAIPVFAEMACKLKDWSEYSYEDMLAYFESRFGLPEFKVYVETGNLYGLMAIQAIMPVTEKFVSIEILWTAENKPGLTKVFLSTAEEQAKAWGINKLITTIKRPALVKRYASKAEEKYGFHPYSITAVKEIGG